MAAKSKSGGPKVTRTETVSVRLDPKLRIAAELAAAKERRTLSSFIELAVEAYVQDVKVVRQWHEKSGNFHEVSAYQVAESTWDVDEPDRFANLALDYPELLTLEEQRLWKVIREWGFLWGGGKKMRKENGNPLCRGRRSFISAYARIGNN